MIAEFAKQYREVLLEVLESHSHSEKRQTSEFYRRMSLKPRIVDIELAE